MAGNHRARRRHLVPAVAAASIALCAGAATAIALAPGGDGARRPVLPRRRATAATTSATTSLDLDYKPGNGKLDATASIAATATQELSAFNLDYRGPRVRSVTVDGEPAAFGRSGPGADGHARGRDRLRGRRSRSWSPTAAGRSRFVDPDGSVAGWIPTDDGAFVAGEPQGSPTWFPCNDHPTDKATFDFAITVPRGVEAIANGALVERRRHGRRVTWRWAAEQPMATYLATATIGQFRVERERFDGLESVVAVDPREARAAKRPLRRIKRITRFFSKLFGPYPFGQTGAIVDHAPAVGYALETQTRPIYSTGPVGGHGRPRDRPPVVRRLGQRRALAGHLAQRGLRDLGGVALGRAARRPDDRAGVRASSSARPASRTNLWDPPPGIPGGPRAAVQRVGLHPRRDGARGAAPADRRADLLSTSCAPGSPSTPTATARSTSSSRSPRRVPARTSTSCSSATCSSRASPRRRSPGPGNRPRADGRPTTRRAPSGSGCRRRARPWPARSGARPRASLPGAVRTSGRSPSPVATCSAG